MVILNNTYHHLWKHFLTSTVCSWGIPFLKIMKLDTVKIRTSSSNWNGPMHHYGDNLHCFSQIQHILWSDIKFWSVCAWTFVQFFVAQLWFSIFVSLYQCVKYLCLRLSASVTSAFHQCVKMYCCEMTYIQWINENQENSIMIFSSYQFCNLGVLIIYYVHLVDAFW